MARFIINMNGDKTETLRKQFIDVNDHARELEIALQQAKPNGRNYQNHETDAEWKADIEEWKEHMANVKSIQKWAIENGTRTITQGGC